MKTETSLKWRGQEVQGMWSRAALALVFFLTWPLCLLIILLSIPLHYLLLALGRRGFVRWSGGEDNDDEWEYYLSRQGFLRV